jgi:catechol 2,3-dioxygenase-like lactoylglutathione lyase family enzyme
MSGLHHVGYWVRDLETAVADAVRTLGVGPFLVHRHVSFSSFRYADGREVSDPAHFDHSAAFAAWGPVVLELAEIHSIDDELARRYDVRYDGVGHVSWVAADLAAESRWLVAAGCPLIHTASSGAISVAWHEGGALFPHPIEVHRAGPPILGMHGRLADLARSWDGGNPMRPMAPGA